MILQAPLEFSSQLNKGLKHILGSSVKTVGLKDMT